MNGNVSWAHRKPDRERGALSRLTLHGDLSTEEAREPARDRESESGSALHRVAAGTGVHLLELVEDALLIARRDTDSSVDHLERDPCLSPIRRAIEQRRIFLNRAAATRCGQACESPTHGDA